MRSMRQATVRKVALLAVCGGLLLGCRATVEEQPRPLYLGVAYDVSGSVADQPALTMDHIDRLVALLARRGGTLAFGAIDDRSFQPLIRVRLEPVVGPLDKKADIAQRNKASIAEFRAKIQSRLERPRNAPLTDINGALARFSLFFNEPAIPADAEKVLLVLSDGIDTNRHSPERVQVPGVAKVFTVGMTEATAHQWFGEQAVLFESIEAALISLGKGA